MPGAHATKRADQNPDLEVVALDYLRRLGQDNHRRLSKLYAWEEKKSKTSWGAQTVDYEKIAASEKRRRLVHLSPFAKRVEYAHSRRTGLLSACTSITTT